MKALLTTLGCLLILSPIAQAQPVSVQVVLAQEQYLPGETLPVKVRIANFSGQSLELGKDNSWLTFLVEDGKHFMVSARRPVPVQGAFSLETSTTGTKLVDLSQSYDLSRAGRYYVTAILTVPQWGQTFQAKAVPFDVIQGSNVWQKDFGMPTPGNAPDRTPEIRRYALVETVHTKTLTLYFRLTDTRGTTVFSVYPIGPMVSFSKLETLLDKFSNLHVLWQTGGRTFAHALITPDGILVLRETFEVTDTRPALRGEPDGRITVVGGLRRPSATDLPPPFEANSAADAKLKLP